MAVGDHDDVARHARAIALPAALDPARATDLHALVDDELGSACALALTDPAVLRAELADVRVEYNTVRLHAGIGYVTPDDEHEGRGPQIRRARRIGLMRARRQRIAYHRLQHHQSQPPESR